MKNQKGFATIVIVLIIAVIAVGGYLLVRTPAPVVDNILPSPARTIEPNVIATADKTTPVISASLIPTDWKTYTDPAGFAVRYPSYLHIPSGQSFFLEEAEYNVFVQGTDINLKFVSVKHFKAGMGPEQPKASTGHPITTLPSITSEAGVFAGIQFDQPEYETAVDVPTIIGYTPIIRYSSTINGTLYIFTYNNFRPSDANVLDLDQRIADFKTMVKSFTIGTPNSSPTVSTQSDIIDNIGLGGPNISKERIVVGGAQPYSMRLGFPKKIELKNGKYYLTMDLVLWFSNDYETGKNDADLSLLEDGDTTGDAPDGFNIRNDEHTLQTFEVSSGTPIYSWEEAEDPKDNIPISISEYKKILEGPTDTLVKDLPLLFDLKDGVIIRIQEQYMP